ncbi:putative RNA-directed DNA polymerase, partial [Tanacetum coccineum]
VVQKPSNNDEDAPSSHQTTSNKDLEQPNSRPSVNMDEGIDVISLWNSFGTLMETDKTLDAADPTYFKSNGTDYNDALEDDAEEVEEVFHDQVGGSFNKIKLNNVKGASTPNEEIIPENNLCLCAILESHVANSNLQGLCSKVFKFWHWTSNMLSCVKGPQIILGWNPDIVNVVLISCDDQVMHICVYFKADKKEVIDILGDFNVSLHADEKSTGTSYIDTANLEFYDSFLGSCAVFQPYHVSDHSPAILRVPMISGFKQRPFKFSNILVHNPRFKDIVSNGWQYSMRGFWMFKVVNRLKLLKKPLRKLLYDHGNLCENVKRLRHELDEAQTTLDSDPSNIELREEEVTYLQAFNDATLMEDRFIMQKAKVEWLRLGDANTAYFHSVVKSQVTGNRIDSITNDSGICMEGDQVPLMFIEHYTGFLGQQGVTFPFNSNDLFCNKLTPDIANYMVHDVFDQEIRDAIFSVGDNKALEFFTNGVLLKELNHTIIALIPKVTTPMRINDYRPISCCNVLYICISRIISNRMKESLKYLVRLNQSAFVPGRRIYDNILLTQELMHNYHLDRGTPRCAFKVDIQKAYDTVDWNFLQSILVGFGFNLRMVGWIVECVTSTSFSLGINGSLHGYFKGKRGLRQGDPMSPYLFTLVMEVLNLMLHRRVCVSDCFTYHRYCSKLKSINLCFADDLFLFALGDSDSARVIMDTLEEFKNAFGLTLSLPKPLLISVIAQLICSVLASMHIYWASVFILPTNLMCDLEQLMRGFLWCQGDMCMGKAKVAWDVLCLPKKEGGLNSSACHPSLVGYQTQAQDSRHAEEWDVSSNTDLNLLKCPLCGMQPDSHDHLFFACIFSLQVWEHLKIFTGLSNIPSDLSSIVDFLIPLAKMRSARSVIAKLIFGASCYFIWQERNNRLFMKNKKSHAQVIDSIKATVGLKLLICRFKKTSKVQIEDGLVRAFRAVWKLECSPVVALFSFYKVFPIGFFLGRFFKEAESVGCQVPYVAATGWFQGVVYTLGVFSLLEFLLV